MKKYVLKILNEGYELEKKDCPGEADISEFERHIMYCRHERIVHLIVTVSFAVMTMLSIIIALEFTGIGTMLLTALFAVTTAAYVWHYYFLENSVQKMYIISDNIRSKLRR